MNPRAAPPDTLLVFLGHGDDARGEAEAIVGLQAEFQRTIESHLAVMPRGGGFSKVKIWEWRSDLEPVVGGQKRIDPFLQSAHVAIFVFRTRVGSATWEELKAFRERENRCPVIALFPANGPHDVFDLGMMEDWLDLLKKQKELTSDWNHPASKSITPVEAYRDTEHMLRIVRDQFARSISGLLSGSAWIHLPEAGARWIGSDAELRIAYETTAPSRHPCEGVRIEDFDWPLVREYAKKELGEAANELSNASVLAELGLYSPLASTPKVHRAAVLCFCMKPERFFPEATSSLVVGELGSDSLMVRDVTGPLSRQVSNLVELTRGHLGRVLFFKDGQPFEYPSIPVSVLREAIANAIAHRDYGIAGSVQIRISEKALEIQNPGRFPAGTSWNVLLTKGPLSRPFDPAVCYYLKRQLAMEGVGRGFSVFGRHVAEHGEDSISWESPIADTVLLRIRRLSQGPIDESVIRTRTVGHAGRPVLVYLASTAQDLVAYRQVADDTILRLSQESVGISRLGPLPGEPAAECERKARESDVVVCIVAHRYGFEPENGKGTITRREVDAATAAGKDILVWIVADDHPWAEKKEQDLLTDPAVLANSARMAEVGAGVQALLEFKTWLRATFTCEAFTTPDDLGRKIAIALGAYARQEAKPSAPTAPVRGQVRIVHALQPARHFQGREELVQELDAWVADLASPDRVWSLVAAGGTGKTAVAERVVADMQPGEANVLVWSFYERPDADAFLQECNELFLGEQKGSAGGRLERLERGLRDGRPHLIVLDGLERVQEDAGAGRVRGELSDHSLKLLLRSLAAGLGRARALVTSRYPLVDLQDWTNRGYRDTRLDDLAPQASLAVLRGWGVIGDDEALSSAAAQVGYHALSLAVVGSYLRSFAGGRIEAVQDFNLDAVTGDDPKAAKLSGVLAYYARRLPSEERELLARLSVFPCGVTLELLGVLVDAGGEVAGLLLKAKARLLALLTSLRERGLIFQYRSDAAVTWTAHPFLRERFRELLGCPAERVFDVVAETLGKGLEERPETKPTTTDVLDRYGQLIEATRLAGREREAFDLYWYGLGGYGHLGHVLGEYQRGYRILAAFSPTGRPEDLGATMVMHKRSLLANELAGFAFKLGRLGEARAIRRLDDTWTRSLANPKETSIGLRNSSDVALALGRLAEARGLAAEALNQAEASNDDIEKRNSLGFRANAAHALGDIAAARADFAAATGLEGAPFYSNIGFWHARHHLDLGDLAAARPLANHGLATARRYNWKFEFALFHALLARIDLAEGRDPTPHLDAIRAWTSRTGDMEWIVTAHLLTALHILARGDAQSALGEAETGLLHAVACGFGLLRIELLVALARIRLAWPDPPQAIQAAREALDLSSHPDCGYAWGQADAAQVWGEAYFANRELALARRAFTRALEVRRRIEHPGTAETERWLARMG